MTFSCGLKLHSLANILMFWRGIFQKKLIITHNPFSLMVSVCVKTFIVSLVSAGMTEGQKLSPHNEKMLLEYIYIYSWRNIET